MLDDKAGLEGRHTLPMNNDRTGYYDLAKAQSGAHRCYTAKEHVAVAFKQDHGSTLEAILATTGML